MSALLPRVVIFDLDDTLIQTNAASAATWAYLNKAYSAELGVELDVFASAINTGRKALWAHPDSHREWRHRMAESSGEVLRLAAEQLELAVPETMTGRFIDAYVRHFFRNLALFPQAIETLHTLRDAGVQLAMITNGGAGWQRRKLALHALEPYFDLILVEGEFGVGKPDPSTYQHVMTALESTPGQTWMVGDRLDWDVLAPQALGIRGIWFNFQHAELPTHAAGVPDLTIRSLDELTVA
jgi:putative hydrolase of the HAD superfamily